MKSFFSYPLSILVLANFLLFSCEEKPTKKAIEKKTFETPLIPKKKKKTFHKKQYVSDSITSDNCVAFFTAYGKENRETKLLLSTRLGDMTIQLYEDTPLHRASFVYLIKNGYFNSTCFHRVVPDFVVQGGNSDNQATVDYRKQLHHYLLPSEFRKNRTHKRGALAAARLWEHNPQKKSTPFEFYFVQSKEPQNHLNFEHTIFGEVVKGMDVLDKIAAVEVDHEAWPMVDIRIQMSFLE